MTPLSPHGTNQGPPPPSPLAASSASADRIGVSKNNNISSSTESRCVCIRPGNTTSKFLSYLPVDMLKKPSK